MEHLAILKRSWNLTEKIATGKKKIESRWYKQKRAPWNKIKPEETIYFKNSGEPVTMTASVEKVLQFSGLTPKKVRKIISDYKGLIAIQNPRESYEMNKDKKYCMLIYLKNPKKIQPFNINKAGYGNMSAWISVNNIGGIKR